MTDHQAQKAAETSTVAEAPRGVAEREPAPGQQLVLGLLFGLAFGFLLQKGGVAKYHILVGVLLLEDFTVIKVMMSAVVVGMLGIFTMHRLGMVELHVKPTKLGANVIGGLIFGAGFGLAGYCPGTAAAAVGQGNFDALAAMVGLAAGSFVFAELSGWLGRTVEKWGDRGELLLPELLHVPRYAFVPVFAALLVVALAVLQVVEP